MGWNRQPHEVINAPAPLVPSRWVLAAALALLAGVLLFWLSASKLITNLQGLNVWVVAGVPLLMWIMAFSARACVYGGSLNHHRFYQEQAHAAQQSWQDWSQRYLAVHASCVLLPDQLCASAVVKGGGDLPAHSGVARRITALPPQVENRALVGLQLVLPALDQALQVLPANQALRVTLLSDVHPNQYEALRNAWQRSWPLASCRPMLGTVTLTAELPYQWVDEKLASGSAELEVIIVLQVNGGAAYSDGLAALLLSPDSLAQVGNAPVKGALSRPMPLQTEMLETEVQQFLQTQTNALQAVGLLAGGADGYALASKITGLESMRGASLNPQHLWVLESLCGLSGPLDSWLGAALAVELTQHLPQPLLMLAKDKSQHWISTVTTGEWA